MILEAVNAHSFCLDLPRSLAQLHPVFHVSLSEPFVEDLIPGHQAVPPLPVEIDGQDEFEVKAVLDSHIRHHKLQWSIGRATQLRTEHGNQRTMWSTVLT